MVHGVCFHSVLKKKKHFFKSHYTVSFTCTSSRVIRSKIQGVVLRFSSSKNGMFDTVLSGSAKDQIVATVGGMCPALYNVRTST